MTCYQIRRDHASCKAAIPLAGADSTFFSRANELIGVHCTGGWKNMSGPFLHSIFDNIIKMIKAGRRAEIKSG